MNLTLKDMDTLGFAITLLIDEDLDGFTPKETLRNVKAAESVLTKLGTKSITFDSNDIAIMVSSLQFLQLVNNDEYKIDTKTRFDCLKYVSASNELLAKIQSSIDIARQQKK